MKRVRIGTLLLLIVILAQSLALVIQHRREAASRTWADESEKEMLETRRLALDLYERILQMKEAELERLSREAGDRNDPRYKRAASDLEKLRSDFLSNLQRWDVRFPLQRGPGGSPDQRLADPSVIAPGGGVRR